MNSKEIFNKKNIDNVAIVQNIKNLIYEKKMTLAEGMLQCGYKSSHNTFYKWQQQKQPIPMESLVKIASGLGVDLFAIAPPSYFGIAETSPENKETSTGNVYSQKDIISLVEEIDMLKDYIRLLKKEKTDLMSVPNKPEDEQ
jgi:transcriptional regulator with XRE-family HTH domain